MPPKIDSTYEKECQKSDEYLPPSKATGDEWLNKKILETVSMKGLFVSVGTSEAMEKAAAKWESVAVDVSMAAKSRQAQLCSAYRRDYDNWTQSEDIRRSRTTNKGHAAPKPRLEVVKYECTAAYCQQRFAAMKQQYTDLAAKHKLSRCVRSFA